MLLSKRLEDRVEFAEDGMESSLHRRAADTILIASGSHWRKVMKSSVFIATLLSTVWIFGLGLIHGCGDDNGVVDNDQDTLSFVPSYRQHMREFVQNISGYAKGIVPDFVVIPQNGQELLTKDGESSGPLAAQYLSAIDGVGREDLLYGYDNDNQETPPTETLYMIEFLDVAEAGGVEALVTDYCWEHSKMDDSYSQNAAKGYASFAADHRELDNIPDYPATPFNVNTNDISTLADARNFLYLINPANFPTKTDFLSAIQATNYDLVFIDLFYGDNALTMADVTSLKTKQTGQSRLVIAYMSIGEAEDYRYYWQAEWDLSPPSWLSKENPYWPGNYKVRYWDTTWQAIIYGNDSSYTKMIIDAGFDGVYLDIIDAFAYFE